MTKPSRQMRRVERIEQKIIRLQHAAIIAAGRMNENAELGKPEMVLHYRNQVNTALAALERLEKKLAREMPKKVEHLT